jgi:hypothetical protein
MLIFTFCSALRIEDVEDKKPLTWGMSLNERVLGRRMPANQRDIGFVSFDLIDEEDFTNNGDPQGHIVSIYLRCYSTITLIYSMTLDSSLFTNIFHFLLTNAFELCRQIHFWRELNH